MSESMLRFSNCAFLDAGARRQLGSSRHDDGRIAPSSPLVLMIYAADSGNYADCLRASGFRVEEAHSGPHGVDRAIALQPDLIVLDFGLVGGEIVSRLRRAIASAIPIIALAESRYGAAVAGVSRSEPESAKPPDSA